MESQEIHHVCELERVPSAMRTGSETLRVNHRGPGSASYICGCCNKHFLTICTLHEHLEMGSGYGSYHYDHLLRMAFPKFETQCTATQTAAEQEDNTSFHRLRQSKRKSSVVNDTKIVLKKRRPKTKRLKRKLKMKSMNESDGDVSEDLDNQRTDVDDVAAYKLRTNVRDFGWRNEPISDEKADNVINDGEDSIEDEDGVKQECLDYVSVKVETKEEEVTGHHIPDDYRSMEQDPETDASDRTTGYSVPTESAEDSGTYTYSYPAAECDADNTDVIKDELESHSRGSDLDNDNELSIDWEVEYNLDEDQANDSDAYKDKKNLKRVRSRKGRQTKHGIRKKDDTCKQEEDVEFESSEEAFKDGQDGDGKRGKKRPYHPRMCVCYICGVPVVGSPVKYNEHIAIHIGDEVFVCSQCPRRFPTKSQLRVHEKRHKEYRTHQCHICPARLNTMEALKCHIRIHTDERPFQCPQCPSAFRQHSNLNMHVNRVHLKIKKFKCPQCDSMFSTRWTLQQHAMTHTPGQLQCEVCGRKFNAINSKRRHMQQHSGRRTHFCHICERGFIQRISYVTHMGKHHDIGKDQVAEIEKERKGKDVLT